MEAEFVKKPICVLLDANVWRKNLLLRTAMGSALLYTVNSAGHKLGLPEVTEEEIIKHTLTAAKEAKEKIQRSFRDIQAILGRHSSYTLPNDQDIRNAVDIRFKELGELIVKLPFSLKHAKAALNRVNENIPPSLTKQQFKDAAIWEAVLELAKEYDVHMVSSDGDFFMDKNRDLLHPVLQREAEETSGTIKIFGGLERCLKELQKERPDVDLQDIARKIYMNVGDEIARAVAINNLRAIEITSYDIKPFITEDHDRLAIDYAITLDAVNIDINQVNEGEPASVHFEGNCVYNIKIHSIEHNQCHSIERNWVSTDGEPKTARDVYIQGGTAYIGRGPDRPYTARIELVER